MDPQHQATRLGVSGQISDTLDRTVPRTHLPGTHPPEPDGRDDRHG
jgi:hypothetical protein